MEIHNMTENKKQYRRGAVAVAVVAAAALALTGCSSAPAAPKKSTETLTISSALAPGDINPGKSGNGRAGVYLYPVYEPLIRSKADGTIEAALATSWKVNDTLTSITFGLRKDAKFSNGEVVNAAAVKGSIEYFVSAKGPYAVNLKDMSGITTNGDYEVTINFSTPQPDISTMFNAAFNAGDIIAPAGIKNPADLSKNSFGAGPYMVDATQTISGSSYTYVPNPNYYDQSKIYWPKIVMTTYPDQNSAIQAFKSGQVMYMISDPLTANANEATLPAGSVINYSAAQWTGVAFTDRAGANIPAMGNLKVRQALNYATDRAAIVKALFGKFGEPTTQLQVKGFIGYDAANDSAYPYDPAKAQALLTEAGYPNGFSMDIGYTKSTLNDGQFTALQSQWAKVGVKITAKTVTTTPDLLTLSNSPQVGGILVQSNSNSPYLAYNQPLSVNGSYNILHSTSPALDALYKAAVNAPAKDQEAAWKAVHKWTVDNAWFDVIAALPAVAILSNKVSAPVAGAALVTDLVNIVPKG
jgi:ABC-type transport system substrate-binding protein